MTLHYGPSIAKSGLVFAYDSANTQKSWKGKPTVNILTSGTGFDAAAERSGTSYPYVGVDITSYILSNWSASNNKISMSFEGKRTYVSGGTGGGADGYPVMYIYFSDWTWSASFSTDAYDWTYTSLNNITMPNPAGKTIFVSVYHMNSGDRGLSYSRKHQVEFGEFVSPFVNGTRSNTQAILDLTGNNTVTASSLTYASDNTFSFNGSSDVIRTSNTLITGTSDFTVSVIARTTNSSSVDYIFGNHGVANNATELYFFNGVVSQYIAGSYVNGTLPIVSNQWYHITSTRSSGIVRLYVNGVLDASGSAAQSIPTVNPFTIGNGHDYTSEAFSGNIPVVHVYNRAMTSSEVAQNFAALRGIFGL